MGQCCGKGSKHTSVLAGNHVGSSASPFSKPGRILDSASQAPGVGSAGDTVNAATLATTANNMPAVVVTPDTTASNSAGIREARSKAAEAAERRAQTTTTTSGPLGKKLLAERKKTVSDQLAAGSEQELRRRDMDEGHEARTYN